MDLSLFMNRYYLLLKTHYLLFYSAYGAIIPILNLTLRAHGLSNTEISYSNIILPFLIFFTSPLLGFIADHSRRFILTFNVILSITICLFLIMFFLPTVKSHHIQADMRHDNQHGYLLIFCASQEVATKCATRSECGCSYQARCVQDKTAFNFTFTMSSISIEKDLKDDTKSTCEIDYRVPIEEPFIKSLPDDKSFEAKCEIVCSIPYFCHGLRYQHQVIYVLLYSLIYIIGSALLSNANAIGVSIGFSVLIRSDLIGKQRVWGTIGFGLTAFISSRLYGAFKKESVYICIFIIIALLTIIVTSFISIKNDDETIKRNKQTLNLSALIALLTDFDIFIFLSIALFWGMCHGCMYPFVYLYIDEIAPCQSRSIVGWMSLVSALSEVFALYIARRMLKFFGTNISSIIIFLAFAVRFGGYYFIQQPYHFIFVEAMHFFNFGILYVLMAQKADSIAPPGLSGTLQGIAHGVSHGLGRGIGLLISSLIYIVFQERLLFLVFMILNIIAAIIYSIYFLLKWRKSSHKSLTSSNNDDDEDDEKNRIELTLESDESINNESVVSISRMKINTDDS
ncbi:unnamed protein product [Rotaria socialis]|uniref:Major facilitator superfamily associated domain-containing protein n=1 Tax=Rotaria socialis TaxID=392032 RepID=A0A820SWF1_9BILA|nr:unnamed protein product [Rotaria socialis]CAF4459114.1 unnamed protein product [Rotaria socialis]